MASRRILPDILGAYHQETTNHVFLASSDDEADNYDAINTANHVDTGIALASTNGYIKTLGFLTHSGTLAAPIFCTETGGSSTDPVKAAGELRLICGKITNGGDNGKR